MNYNLLEEKWIPVLWKDGHSGRVGIVEAFTQAGRIRQIAASNPMDRMAILRFLLALLYWCKGNPPDDRVRSLYFLRNGSRNSMTTRIVSTFWVMARDSIRTKLPSASAP